MAETHTVTLGDFLTDQELLLAIALYKEGTTGFHQKCVEHIVKPAIDRINRDLKSQNDPGYIAYMIEYALFCTLPTTENDNEPQLS